MAGLTKTYTGDLTQAIAGKIWSVIKEEDEKRKIEDSEASKEVKDAAKKLLKEDKDSIPVKDRDLRDTLANIFIPVETKLSKTKSTTDGLSAKITSIGGSIADTQNLIINQNEILEEKLDRMLDVIGTKNHLANKALTEARFDQLENTLEGMFDVAGTFGLHDTTSGGRFKALYNIFDEAIIRSLTRRIGKGNWTSKALLNVTDRGLWKLGLKIFGRKGMKKFLGFKPGAPKFKGSWGSGLEKLVNADTRSALRASRGKGPKNIFKPAISSEMITRNKGIRKNVGEQAFRTSVLQGAGPDKAIKEATKKFGKGLPRSEKLAQRLNKSGLLRRFWNSKVARSALVEKLGETGVAKLGKKVAAGAFKGQAPLFGTAYGAVEGIARLLMGDPKGMMLSFGSAIPIGGWAFTMIDILRDIDREAYDRHIEPNMPMVSDDDFGRFFMEALGISPDQFERGSGHISPSSFGIGGSIEQIVGATLAIGKAAGIDTKSLVTDAGLGSVNPKGTFSFDISSNVSGTSEPTSKMVRDRELPQIRKKKQTQQEILKETNDKATVEEKKTQDSRWLLDPRRHFNFGNKSGKGGIGGDPVSATDTIAGDGTVIEFWGQQGKDRSGEPGVDFSFRDYKSNYNLFPGTVLETGLLYGARYGNVVVVRSIDPSNGQEFDSLYSHFPNGGMAVEPGQSVGAGQYLGKVGFVSVDTPGVPQMQPDNAGNMSGWHTSVDFFEPGSSARYRNLGAIQSLVTGANGKKPNGLLEKLAPPVKNEEDLKLPPPLPPISNNLDNIDGGKSLVSQAISNGSMERLVKKRNSAVSVPIIVNNQVAASSPSSSIQISSGGGSGIGWEQIQNARLGVA